MDSWKKDILNSVLYTSTPDLADVNSLLDQYNVVLSDLIEKHAPECSRSITVRPNAPWFNDSLRAMKSQRRKLERKYLSTRLEVHRQMYRGQRQIYTAALHSAKSTYYKAKISESDNNQLFSMVDGLFKVKRLLPLPSHVSCHSLAEDLGEFFHSKIEEIRDRLHNSNAQSTETSVLIKPSASPCPTSLSEFTEVSETYIRELIDKSKPKSCCLDPIPTHILKQSVDVLAHPITKVVNASLMTGEFPFSLKKGTMYPSIKKQTLDQQEFTSYRPTTNVAFLSKTLERVVAAQTINYQTDNDLMSKLQSAYRHFYSTETALLRVCNDILLALDSRQEVVLVLLSLSSAFDTIDHEVLLDRLRSRYGIKGTALNWFRSYLTNRTQSVRIGEPSSSNRTLKYGVPQGSVLGPLLFSLFFAPIEEGILDHGLCCMVYAGDTQLYITVKARCDLPVMLSRLQLCIIDIFTWCTNNGLACSLDKTELTHLRSCHAKNFDPIQEIVIDNVVIVPKPVVRDLGLLIDSHLLLKNQVNQVCKCAWSAIRKIGRIRSHLTQDVWILATQSYMVYHPVNWTSYNEFRMRQQDWLPWPLNLTTLPLSCLNSTGFLLKNESPSSCFLSHLRLCMVKHLHTSVNS